MVSLFEMVRSGGAEELDGAGPVAMPSSKKPKIW